MAVWRRACSWALAGLVATQLLVAGGCARGTPRPSPEAAERRIVLPAPRLEGEVSLEETLSRRRSARDYTDRPLTWGDIGQLLWATQGVTADWGARTAPSAGALYPLELYVCTAEGVHRYVPQGHQLEKVSSSDARDGLWEAALLQNWILEAPAVFAIIGVYERTELKYGDRAERYVKLEAGHACQNLLLQAVALDLGAVPVGAFYDDQVQAALELPADHEPLYLVPVGHPR